MDLTPYLSSLREDLSTAAAAGDEQLRRAAAVLSAALEPAARLMLLNALSDLAAEVTANLPGHVVEVRLDGRDARVVVTETGPQRAEGPTAQSPPSPPHPSADAGDASGDISRMTLRLFEQLKSQAEQAAAAQGVSLNTFVSQAVQGALRGTARHHGPAGSAGPANSGGPGGHHWRSGRGGHLHGWVEG